MTHRIYPLSNKQNIGGLSFSERVKSETHKKKQQAAITRYSKNVPILDWDYDFIVYKRNCWNPFTNVNICFQDNSKNGQMSFTIECNMSKLNKLSSHNNIAMGFFFIKNTQGDIDILFKKKMYSKKAEIILYKNCTYFGLFSDIVNQGFQFIKESKFIISNDNQDKAVKSIVNFNSKSYYDFHYVVDYINDFIQNIKVESGLVPLLTNAYPLLECENYEQDQWGSHESHHHDYEDSDTDEYDDLMIEHITTAIWPNSDVLYTSVEVVTDYIPPPSELNIFSIGVRTPSSLLCAACV